jgi:subtilisin family serine protease
MKRISALSKGLGVTLLVSLMSMTAAQAESARYTILMKNHSVPANFADAVESAGGQLANSLESVGIAVAVSSDANFADAIASDSRVKMVGLTGYYSLPEVIDSAAETGPTASDDLYNIGLVWGVERVHAPEAWAAGVTGSHDTVVAVIDTGVAWNHPDLAPNVVDAACYASVPGCNPYPSYSDHGTHVAGTVAAAFGGGRVVGVAPDIGIAGYNVFEPIQGCGVCAYTDVRWAAMMDAADRGYEVITMSLGGYGVYGGGNSSGLATYVAAEQRIAQAINQMGTVVIASAGNGGLDLNGPIIHVPGDVPSIINVGATGIQAIPRYIPGTSYDIRAFYSNYGAAVTVSGPGGDCGEVNSCTGNPGTGYPWWEYLVLSTIVFENPACAATSNCPTGYGWKGGTSMATPHVAAVAGLILDENPDLSPKQVQSIIKRTAEKIGSRQEFGHGMVDARAAIDD